MKKLMRDIFEILTGDWDKFNYCVCLFFFGYFIPLPFIILIVLYDIKYYPESFSVFLDPLISNFFSFCLFYIYFLFAELNKLLRNFNPMKLQ